MVSFVMLAIVWAALVWSRPATTAGSLQSPNEVKEDQVPSGFDLKTTGQKWSSGEYQTLSSLTSSSQLHDQQHDDHDYLRVQVDDNRPEEPKMNEGHVKLTTDMPPLLVRTKYVKSPAVHSYSGGRSTGHYQDDTVDDQNPEYSSAINVNVGPKWSRYYPGHRQLKKYGIGPVTMEMDVAVDGNGVGASGYSGQYDNAVDYSYSGANYYPDGYKSAKVDGYAGSGGYTGNDDGGGEVWYGEDPSHASYSRPAPAIMQAVAASRLPKMTASVQQKLGWLAIVTIGVAKLLIFKAIKFFVLSAIKLKLLVLFLYAKWYVASKFFKLIFIPFVPSLLKNLLMMLMPSSSMTPMMAMMMPMTSDAGGTSGTTAGTSRNSSSAEPANVRSTFATDVVLGKIATTENLLQLVATISSAKCAENLACHVASTRPYSFQSLWTDWILSSLVNYIPNQKFKSYVSTFKDVSNYRLENIFNNPSTEEWLKWCDERYFCSDGTSINNNLM